MKKFIERALPRLTKLDTEQIRSLILDMAGENETLELVLHSMRDGVVVLDSDHAVIMNNNAAERLLPLKHGESSDSAFWDVLADSDLAAYFKEHLERNEQAFEKDFTLDSSGALQILSCMVVPLKRDEEHLGSLVLVEDVTLQKGDEARLRRAENLASLTTLAAGVAHEIKNPLGSLGIHIQLIQKLLRAESHPDTVSIERYLEVVNEEIDRLNGIVVDFLFAVRPMNARFERANINQLILDTLEFVQFELDEANVTISKKLFDRVPKVDIDEKYIKQALLNIIKNAISAMPSGGELTITTRIGGSDVVLEVSDTGVGIPEEQIGKIFEPYFTTKEFGSGLGLTVVYKIIKEHGGEISLRTREHKGTTFVLTFPIPRSERNRISWEDG